jgi:hypothetical protein
MVTVIEGSNHYSMTDTPFFLVSVTSMQYEFMMAQLQPMKWANFRPRFKDIAQSLTHEKCD